MPVIKMDPDADDEFWADHASQVNLGVDVAGERAESGAAKPEHALSLDLTMRF